MAEENMTQVSVRRWHSYNFINYMLKLYDTSVYLEEWYSLEQ